MEYRFLNDNSKKAIEENEPVLILVPFDDEVVLIGHIDDAVEHHILLSKLGYNSLDIDKYYRIIADKDGVNWTFVCPSDYMNIQNRDKRLDSFYNNGETAILDVVKHLGLSTEINIPKRYQRQ